MNLIIDLTPLAAALEEAGIKTNEFANAAVRRVASKLAERWIEYIKVVPGIRPDERSEYMSSIGFDMVGPASAVVSTSFKNARQIEEGRPAYDMKQMLQTSIRTKITKDGRRYLTIPMGHGTPGTNSNPMPPNVYARAKQLDVSTVTRTVNRVNGLASNGLRNRWLSVAASRNARGAETKNSNYVVPQNVYQWGGRLTSSHKNLDGMVRMLGGTDKNRQQSGKYLTFRTMVEGSPGWIQPAKPGLFILRSVAAYTQADAPDIVRELLYEMR